MMTIMGGLESSDINDNSALKNNKIYLKKIYLKWVIYRIFLVFFSLREKQVARVGIKRGRGVWKMLHWLLLQLFDF